MGPPPTSGTRDSFAELMEGTDWEQYGVGKYDKCANCMTHCGFEGTAATDAIRHPLKMMSIGRNGVKTSGPLAPELDLTQARAAEDVYATHVERELSRIKAEQGDKAKRVQAVG